MQVKITTPNGVIIKEDVEKIRIDGAGGQVVIKPKYIDMTTSFEPSLIKIWEKGGNSEGYYLGVGYGVCVKRNDSVYISSFRVLESDSLEEMKIMLDEEFKNEKNSDAETRKALAYLETSMARYIYNL